MDENEMPGFENHEKDSEQIIKEVVRAYLDGETSSTINFLRNNPEDVFEFCIQVQDSYAEDDRRTPIAKLAKIIEELVK